MALVRQLQHLLVHWDHENHAEVFVYSQEQANKPTKPQTTRSYKMNADYSETVHTILGAKKQRRVSLSAAGKRELFRRRTCSCCIIHRAEVCSSESLK